MEMNSETMMTALDAVAENDVVALRIMCSCSFKNESQYNLEQVDLYGNTPLLKACYLNRIECAHTLLKFGANVSAINFCGQNALTLATYSGNLNLVELLLGYRSYKDFNESSIVPAICVAALRNFHYLMEFFNNLETTGNAEDIDTVHGLNARDIQEMLTKYPRTSC